jgi:hypothetical protein
MIEYHDEEQEPRNEVAQDYYAGYYWGNEPYMSYDLPGRKSDSEIKSSILERVVKVLNEVQVTEPETAGPSKIFTRGALID